MSIFELIWGLLSLIIIVFLISGLSFSRIPGPIWHLPFLGETLEFMDSPVKVWFKMMASVRTIKMLKLIARL